MPARFFGISRGNPFEQMLVRDVAAIDRANNGVGHQACLVTDKCESQCQLRRISSQVSPDIPKVAGPGNSARMGHHAGGHVEIDRKRHRDHYEKTP